MVADVVTSTVEVPAVVVVGGSIEVAAAVVVDV